MLSLDYGLAGGADRALVRAVLEFAPDVVVFWSSVHEASGTRRCAEFVRDVRPEAKIVVWGDGPLWMPQYFTRDPFDACVVSGDPEIVLLDAVRSLATRAGLSTECGSAARSDGIRPPPESGYIELWPLPAPEAIRTSDYDAAREHRGKPGRDLSVTVARGCKIRCVGCVDPIKSGIRDRRMPC